MSVWKKLGELVARLPKAAGNIVEAVKTVFAGDAETRRRVAFSVAMIALSAKMAKADGVVTQDEIRAFEEIFEIPASERRNVRRLYNIAMGDVAGFETYAGNMARLCGSGDRNCPFLADILDGLFHIAKADGVIHERELAFLQRIGEIFDFDDAQFDMIAARHVETGGVDPYRILGVDPSMSLAEIKKAYRRLVSENHPDRLIARGLPEEFLAIATERLAAINDAYTRIERYQKAG